MGTIGLLVRFASQTRHPWSRMKPLTIAVLVLGLAFVAGGGLSQRRIHRLAKQTSVSGTIVGFARESTWRTAASFPTIDFRTLAGESMRVTVPQGRVFTRVKVGKPV